MTPVLRLLHVAKSYRTPTDRIQVIEDATLDVLPGESLALVGESGSGKSTLLHLAAGLDWPDAGEIRLAGTAIERLGDAGRAALRRQAVGLVFQQFNLIPSLDVAANLAFQSRLAGRHEPRHLTDLAERLGLLPLLGRYPEQLSGGQQQRVAIGRALATRPRLLLADEPTGSLDEATGDAVLELMLALCAETGAALVMATHSSRLAERLGGRVRLHAGRLA